MTNKTKVLKVFFFERKSEKDIDMTIINTFGHINYIMHRNEESVRERENTSLYFLAGSLFIVSSFLPWFIGSSFAYMFIVHWSTVQLFRETHFASLESSARTFL